MYLQKYLKYKEAKRPTYFDVWREILHQNVL